jgi:hypothetical protein
LPLAGVLRRTSSRLPVLCPQPRTNTLGLCTVATINRYRQLHPTAQACHCTLSSIAHRSALSERPNPLRSARVVSMTSLLAACYVLQTSSRLPVLAPQPRTNTLGLCTVATINRYRQLHPTAQLCHCTLSSIAHRSALSRDLRSQQLNSQSLRSAPTVRALLPRVVLELRR